MRVGTLFTGLGAPEVALARLKIPHTIDYACELDEGARKVYLDNFSPKRFDKDVSTVTSLPELDLVIMGPPCQDWSIAGKQDLGTGRSLLMFKALQLVLAANPKYIIIENVKSLLNKTFKAHFNTILNDLSINYRVQYDVLNAVNFGVPHHRERVFIVAIRKDVKGDFVMPTQKPIKCAADCIERPDCGDAFCEVCDCHYSECGCPGPDSENCFENIADVEVDRRYYLSAAAVARIKNIHERAKIKGYGYKDTTIDYQGIFLNLDYNYHKGPDGKRSQIQDARGLRMATINECRRLMGFPDWYVLKACKTKSYSLLGNSICIPVLEELIRSLPKMV